MTMNKLSLTSLLDIKRLQKFQDAFSEFLKIGLFAIDVEWQLITQISNPHYFCKESFHEKNSLDQTSPCYTCLQSLIKYYPEECIIATPCHTKVLIFSITLQVDGQLLGYIIGGQEYDPATLDQLHSVKKILQELATVLCTLTRNSYIIECRNEELARATELKSHFLANMSHEIRTPMNAITGMAEMALREDLPHNARNYISQIKSSGKVLLTIINDILDFSKIESGKLEISLVEYEVLSLINDIVSTLTTRIGDKDLKLIINLSPNIPRKLYGDDVRLKQVLINLANNAIKFTPHGYVTINVDGKRENNKFMLSISVKDTGIGIKQEDMPRLFGLFQQLDSKRNRNIEGTGLGLKISKELVRLMDGTISVNSVYGQGSEFSFTVPQTIVRDTPCGILASHNTSFKIIGVLDDLLIEASLSTLLSQLKIEYISCHSLNEVLEHPDGTHLFVSQSCYAGELKEYMDNLVQVVGVILTDRDLNDIPQHLKLLKLPIYCLNIINLLDNIETTNDTYADLENFTFQAPEARILIVDDNPINLTVTIGLLDPLNMYCDTALSGDEAISLIKQHEYDIIFMDHMMPGKDGVETTHEIRSMPIPYCLTVPIIALSANALRGAREMFIDEGMNDFVAKPIELRELIRKIHHWLPAHKIIKSSRTDITQNNKNDEVPKIAGLDTEFGLSMSGNLTFFLG